MELTSMNGRYVTLVTLSLPKGDNRTFIPAMMSQRLLREIISHFVNETFKKFTNNCIRHNQVYFYHLSSNSLIERVIQVFRNGVKLFSKDNINLPDFCEHIVRLLGQRSTIPQ